MLRSSSDSSKRPYGNIHSCKNIVGRDSLAAHQRSKKQMDASVHLGEKDTVHAEFYGYAMYLITISAFVVYLVWAYIPNEYLDAMGWTYYPNKDWAVTIPAFLFAFLFFALAYHIGYVLCHTPSIDSLNIITDECATVIDDSKIYNSTHVIIPPFEDVPIRCIS